MLEPFIDTALRYSVDGNLAAVGVYNSDGTNTTELSGSPALPDVFRNGQPVKIELNNGVDAEVVLPQTFVSP
jgi:hypothetical protein